tara:strand:+ start:291 stop:863 length:573 start_codon:yes stop_codon:yes gene_type:complete
MKKIFTEVGVNDFVKRQIKNNGKTYSETLSFKEIAILGKTHLSKGAYKTGYRDGVILIPIDKSYVHHFICPFVKINEKSILKAKLVSRRPEEEPYIQIRALDGIPIKTGSVELILYRQDVLAETNEQTTNFEWELISFHAIPKGIKNMPMGPTTMMRNQLQLKGGTKGFYSSEEWAKSIEFWQKFAILER